jgi:heme oxygenase
LHGALGVRETSAETLIRLNLETRDSHADADAAWLSLLTPDLRIPDYAAMLIKTYGFEAALEAALAYTPRLDERLDLRARARSGFLAEDLLALQFPPSDIARLAHAEIVPFTSDATALGWMYVADRATLSHGVIRRQILARRPELADATA